MPDSALAAPRLCESLPAVCSSHASQVAQSPRLMEPPRALESSTGRLCVPRVASSAKPIARPFDSSRTTVRACVRSAWSYRACWRRRPAAKPAVQTLLCFFVHTCIVTAFELPRPKSIAACRLPQPDPRTSRVRKCASPQPPGRGLPSFFICQHV